MAKDRKKKVKEPFWKKWGPDAKHITDHAGKIIDRSTISDVRDAVLDLALAYFGIKAFGRLEGAIIGPVSLRLATAHNAVAGAAGTAGLAVMGLCSMGRVQDIVDAIFDPDVYLVDGQKYERDEIIAPSFSPDFPYELVCPEGYDLKRGPSAAFCVLRS